MKQLVECKKNVPSGTIVINRPEKRNALSRYCMLQIKQALEDFHQDRSVRAGILIGAGDAFCAGMDLQEMQETSKEQDPQAQWHDDAQQYKQLVEMMLRFPKPLIAAVNGPAVAGGAGLVLACDLVVAGRSARFDSRFLTIGIHPGGGHTWRLRNITDLQTAKAMVLFEQTMDGEQAARRGVAWDCVDDDILLDQAVEYAERAAGHPRELVAVTKQTLHDTAAVTESIPSVQLEIEPQVWSMRQPAFTEMVAELKARIADKG